MKGKNNIWRGVTATLAVVLSISIFMTNLLLAWSGQVNVFLHVTAPTIQGDEDTMVYKSDYELSDDGLKSMLEDSDRHDIQTMEEGAVLLTNQNNALPLAESERSITLFGRSVEDPVYRGNSGGPSVDPERQISLYGALKNKGFTINDTLFDAYANSTVQRAKADPDWFIGEEDASFYSDSLKKSFQEDYHDVAIVMLSRDGGEGKDPAFSDRDGISFLALHDSEKDLLKMIQESGVFQKTIVLINSAYAMELEWLYEEEYGVDAALWIGNPGLKGFDGVASLLIGDQDPSGRLVDTFAANSLSAPAVRNAGDFTFSNDKGKYIVEAEGIYSGYKYYETRYQDQVLAINNADSTSGAFANEEGWNYSDEMTFPFGYGMSYANFEQELQEVVWDKTTHTVTAKVLVKNLGYPEGSEYQGTSKTVVELYVQLPYEKGQAEKSAIQLIGFAKTKELSEGESEEITIEVDDYLFATYDVNAKNGASEDMLGCYVFDAGDYYFAIGNNSHDALNNVIATKEGANVSGKLVDADGSIVDGDVAKVYQEHLEQLDNISYAKSQHTGEIVSNQFEDIDLNYFLEDEVTYLTRSDWTTYPKPYTDVAINDDMSKILYEEKYKSPSDAPEYSSFTQGADATIKFQDMKGVAFDDDDTWNQFLNQLTIGELCATIGENFGQPAVSSIGKPANTNTDGPDGSQSNYQNGERAPATVHVSEIVATSTWNQDLIAERGRFIAEDCLFSGTTQLWSPGANLHRTPFSGRNFEYYSEDSIMSYIMGSIQTKAMQEKGLNAAIKHFCANDQETNRTELSIFMNEQAYRQGALKGFEGAFTVGGALGTMMSCSRIGLRLMYTDKATLTHVMRDEWGFQGVTITDSVKGSANVPTLESLMAGTDTFNADTGRGSEVQKYLVANKDGKVLEQLRAANKRFYYSMVNSNLVNGLTSETVIEDFVPWWQPVLYGWNGVVGVCMVGSFIVFLRSGYRKKEKEVEENEVI